MGFFCLRYFLICIFLLLKRSVLGRLVNSTIDDQSLSLFYSPEDAWNDSEHPCQNCSAHPDASMTINGTWHDSTVSLIHSLRRQLFTLQVKFDQDAQISPNQVRNVSTIFNGEWQFLKRELFA